jgi:hypothetical protein
LPVESIPTPIPVTRTVRGFEVQGVAAVDILPERRVQDAKRLAERISIRPLTYLPLCLSLSMPGIRDLRTKFGKVVVAHG